MPARDAYPLTLTTTWLTAHRRDLHGRKLPVYLLTTRDTSAVRGRLEYSPRWRRFVLAPAEQTVWESTCLTEVSRLCDELTALHRVVVRVQKTRHGASATPPEEE